MKRVCWLALCLLLSSCGGGSAGALVDNLLVALSPTGNSLRGTAAVGLALADSDVKVRCPSTNRARYSITISAENPALVTVLDTTAFSDARIFDGQVVTLESTGKLPPPLNGYQSYFIVNTVKPGNSATQFNLSDSPTGVPILSTNGAKQSGYHTLVPSSIIERTVTTDAKGTFEIDALGDFKALAPCVLEISPKDGAKLHSIALSLFGVANITPLTDALLATLVEVSDLTSYFSTFNEADASALSQLATTKNIQAVWEKIKSGLIANGFDVSAIQSEPMTQPLYAAYNCGGEVKITLDDPAVFEFTGVGTTSNDLEVSLKTSGALPQALSETKTYYVVGANAKGNEFQLSEVKGSTPLSTKGNAQSGVQLAYVGNKLCTNVGNAYDKLLDNIKAMDTDALMYASQLAGKEKLITLVKLDSNGVALKNQFAKWQDNGSEQAGTQWDCVHDTANKVFWEVKRNDAKHQRHKGHKYTWFDSSTTAVETTDATTKKTSTSSFKLNGGSDGVEFNTTCKGVGDPAKCNTESFAKSVNNNKLCGFDTWVVPSVDELQKFPLNYAASVLANTDYFPDLETEPTASTPFWTRTPSANNPLGNYAWNFNFGTGKVSDGLKSSARPVRLMLAVQSYAAKVTTTIKTDESKVIDYGITEASKGAVTLDSSPKTPIASDQLVSLRTAGFLPQTLSQFESYYTVGADATSSTFQLSKAQSGLPINTLAIDKEWKVAGPHFVVVGGKPTAKQRDADTCIPSIEVMRPGARFTAAAGEVTDSQTKLIWRQCVEGLSGDSCSTGQAKAATQAEAVAAATRAAGADKKPWRLPSKQELASLVDRKCTGVWKYKTVASGLWITSRLFTVTGGWEQEVTWSNPVLVDTQGMEFSQDTKSWHESKDVSIKDVYMRKISPPGTAIRIAGESGNGWTDGVPPDPLDSDPGVNVYTTLGEDVNNTATSITVASTAGFPPTGLMRIDDEYILYTGATSTTFTGLTRGTRSSANAHAKDAKVRVIVATPLWYTKRLFTASGAGAQEATWSKPVQIKDDSKLEFSADNLSWHFPPKSNDVHMREGPTSPSIIMRGEVGGVSSPGTTLTGVAFFRGQYVEDLDPFPKGGSFTKPLPDYPLLTTSSKQGMVTGYAFYRGDLPPSTPKGGSFAYPAPESVGWKDGIPKEVVTSEVVSAADSARAINQTKFPQGSTPPFPQAIWTGTLVPSSSAAWIVNFYDGSETTVDGATQGVFVRLVRSP